MKGKGDEGSFIFVGRGCLFFFCETFWHDFGMDGLEFLILINAVRFFKKGMELVIPSFYVYLCASCSSRVLLILILITIVSRQQGEERV